MLLKGHKPFILTDLTKCKLFLDKFCNAYQIGVIKAVKSSVAGSGEVAALWVTHRLEELKYADGAIYMEDGRIVMQGDTPSVSAFLREKQAQYRNHLNL